MNRPTKPDRLPPSRREFARTLALLAAAPLAAGPVLAQDVKPPPSDPLMETAKALSEIARIRYGKFLTEDQQKAVQRRIASAVRTGEQLRRFKLVNSDEPAFIFRADVP
jgi:predicted secreted protein